VSDTTTTTQTKLNKWLRAGTRKTAGMVDQWGETAQYIGMSDPQRQSLLDMQRIAQDDVVNKNFQEQYAATVRGDHLDASNNPYLQDVVNRSVSSAGRDPIMGSAGGNRIGSGVFANAMADARAGVSANLYENNYRTERGYQNAAMGMAPIVDQMQYAGQQRFQDIENTFRAEQMSERDWELQKAGMMNAGYGGNPLMGAGTSVATNEFDTLGFVMQAGASLDPLGGLLGTGIGGQGGQGTGGTPR